MKQDDIADKAVDCSCNEVALVVQPITKTTTSTPSSTSPHTSLHLLPDSSAMTEDTVYHRVVKYYYQIILGYPYVYSGLQFGCHFVLYKDHPQKVHSTYAIYILHPDSTSFTCTHDDKSDSLITDDADLNKNSNKTDNDNDNDNTSIPWYTIQTLVRMMADLHKTLVLVHIEEVVVQTNATIPPKLQYDDNSSTATTTTSDTKYKQALSVLSVASPTNCTKLYYPETGKTYSISELTITTEHAPFRQPQSNIQEKIGSKTSALNKSTDHI
jgi:tRNA intron endonuclease, catalytic C-terminal domain